MKNKKPSFDFDPNFASPAAWRKLKEAGRAMGLGIEQLLLQLESSFVGGEPISSGKVRMWLAATLHHFLALPPKARAKAWHDYHNWFDQWSKAKRASGEVNPPVNPNDRPVTRHDIFEAIREGQGEIEQPKKSQWPFENGDDDDSEGDEWKDAKHEGLPEHLRVSDAEFTAAMWAATAPVGWKMPPLPDGIKLVANPRDDIPPIPFSSPAVMHCPKCGKAYRDVSAFQKHLNTHGIETGSEQP